MLADVQGQTLPSERAFWAVRRLSGRFASPAARSRLPVRECPDMAVIRASEATT